MLFGKNDQQNYSWETEKQCWVHQIKETLMMHFKGFTHNKDKNYQNNTLKANFSNIGLINVI